MFFRPMRGLARVAALVAAALSGAIRVGAAPRPRVTARWFRRSRGLPGFKMPKHNGRFDICGRRQSQRLERQLDRRQLDYSASERTIARIRASRGTRP